MADRFQGGRAKNQIPTRPVEKQNMKSKAFIITALLVGQTAIQAQEIIITSISQNGQLTWSSRFTNNVHQVEWTSSLGETNKWTTLMSVYVTNATTTVGIPTFYRITASTNADPIVGVWNWFSGDKVRFFADGTLTKTNLPSAKGVWQQVYSQSYLVMWTGSTYIDNLTMYKTNGITFRGYNQLGTFVSGTRVGL